MDNSKMKMVRISDEEKVFFAGLDPFEILERKKPLPEFSLGVVLEDENGDSDVPVGLMICTLSRQVLVVNWLYVSPEHRGEGCGEELLNAAMSAAKSDGLKYVAAYLSAEYGREYICPSEREYLDYQGFVLDNNGRGGQGMLYMLPLVDDEQEYEEEPVDIFAGLYSELLRQEELEDLRLAEKVETACGSSDNEELLPDVEMWEYTASDISKSALAGDKKDYKNAIALSQISLPVFGACLKKCLKKHPYDGPSGRLYELPVEWFDIDLSSCVLEGGKICGIFLVHKESDSEYLAEYLFDMSSESRDHLLQMLMRSAAVFVKNCPPDTRLKVVSRKAAVKELVDNIFCYCSVPEQ